MGQGQGQGQPDALVIAWERHVVTEHFSLEHNGSVRVHPVKGVHCPRPIMPVDHNSTKSQQCKSILDEYTGGKF